VAQMLKNKLGERVLVEAFANSLKDICARHFGYKGVKDQEDRDILIRIGTDIARKNNPDIWVNIINEIIWAFRTEYDYFVISDCRFINECTVLQDNGYSVISVKIERPNFDNGLSIDQKNHLSESSMNDYEFDYIIINDGTLEDLERKVDKFIKTEVLNV
jgi:hypothetical protein